MVADGPNSPRLCFVDATNIIATVTNTEKVTVFAAPAHVAGGYRIDQNNGRFAPGATPETDGNSEIEITLVTTGAPAPRLTVAGTPQSDVISVGTGGRVNFSYDNDADVIPQTMPDEVLVTGGVGNDELDSNAGGIFSAPADLPVDLQGNAGNDRIVATGKETTLRGGSGDDVLFSANGIRDHLTGGTDFDVATLDKTDNAPFPDIEQKSFLDQVGRLNLAPAVIDARAGKRVRLNLSWTHPKAWKQLRTVKLRLSQGAEDLGTIKVRPADGSIRGNGAVKVIAGASKLTHDDKTVTARLSVRLDRSLAGQDLRLGVEATDRNGHTQLEPQAGVIRVTE